MEHSFREGNCPATNREIARTVRLLSKEFVDRDMDTQIMVNESSDYRCMFRTHETDWQRGYQIQAFFCPDSVDTYLGDTPNVPRLMLGHSYWTNTPLSDLRNIRLQLRDTLDKYNVDFWQTETCIMGNDEEIGGGGGFDRTMKTALYVARIIHHDIVYAGAKSWQWWRAIGGDYKDNKYSSMKRLTPYSWLILIIFSSCLTGNKVASTDKQIESLLSQMTLEEKIGMLHSNTMFSSTGVPRLGIPDLHYSDGPHGVRFEGVANGWESARWDNDACSYLPALSALASTWNRDLAQLYGEVLGAECKARGKHVSLAPGVNIHRSLLNGRNWEYFSEDPFFSGELAVPYIQGVQSQGVASCVKHFALNSQAYNQYKVSVEVDERTLHEIYLPVGVIKDRRWCCSNRDFRRMALILSWGIRYM